jgi:hypothetical protein
MVIFSEMNNIEDYCKVYHGTKALCIAKQSLVLPCINVKMILVCGYSWPLSSGAM